MRRLHVVLCLLLYLCFPLAAHAAPVAGTADTFFTNGTSPVTGSYSVTAGHCLVAVAWGFNITTYDSVTLDGVAMTPIAAAFTNGSDSARMYIIESLATTGSLTASFAFTDGGNAGLALYELHDGSSGCQNDGYNTGSGTGANPSISVTTGVTDSFMIGFVNPGTAPTAGSGYTQDNIGWWNFEQAEHKAAAGAPGSIVVDWTATAGTWMGVAAGFKTTAGAGAETFGFRRRLQVQP